MNCKHPRRSAQQVRLTCPSRNSTPLAQQLPSRRWSVLAAARLLHAPGSLPSAPHARLRETLLVFLQSGGSYKATAEQMVLHKNMLGSAVLQPTRGRSATPTGVR